MPKAQAKPKRNRYIILPPRGIYSGAVGKPNPEVETFLRSLENVRESTSQVRTLSTAKIKTKMRVIDSIRENGAKLIEMLPGEVSTLQSEQPGVRIVPEVFYFPAQAPRPSIAVKPKPTGASAAALIKISLTIVSQADQSPIAGANVVAFTDFANKVGANGTTNSRGIVALALGSATKKVERLYVYSSYGFWNALEEDITLKNGLTIELQPIDLGYSDALRYFYGNSPDNAGTGVIVGVIDTGIGPNKDVTIAGGENTVQGEDPGDYQNNGEGHGTHVGGIIAAHGTPPNGIRGLAPAATLRSYRVFGRSGDGASNFAIAKALDRAVADGCDLINMSLGGGPRDEATHSAIADARANGCVVIIASGNDGRQPVSFPASDSLSLAVSAFGREGTFPDDSTETGDIAPPKGRDPKNFIADFSNIGPEIVLTGPGVGIISTFPDDHYAVLDGTSMACPAVTGAAAKLLSLNPQTLGLPRNQARSDSIAQLILQAAKDLGFPPEMQGQGYIKV